MVRYKPKNAIPTLASSYRQVSCYFSKLEYYKLFAEHLMLLSQKYFKISYAKRLLKTLEHNRIEIVNMENFLSSRLLYTSDIGTYCYAKEQELMTYTRTVIAVLKKFEQSGLSTIDITSIFFYFTEIRNRKKYSRELVEACLHMIAAALCYPLDTFDKNPYLLRIFVQKEAVKVAERLGLTNVVGYTRVIGLLLKGLLKVKNIQTTTSSSTPDIRMCTLMEYDIRENQLQRLSAITGIQSLKLRNDLKDIPDLTEENPLFLKKLEKYRKLKNFSTMNLLAIVKEMKNIEEEGNACTVENPSHYFYSNFKGYFNLTPYEIRGLNFKEEYLAMDGFLRSATITFSSINIQCSNLTTLKEMEIFIYAAADMLFISRRLAKENEKLDTSHLTLTINLQNITDTSMKFLNEVKKLEEVLCSKYDKNYVITVSYDPEAATTKGGVQPPQYIRVISDIHADVNAEKNYIFNFGTDFVINCGDTAGSAFKERDWIRLFMRRGIIIPGNHLGYDKSWSNLDENGKPSEFGTIENPNNAKNIQISYLRTHFKGWKALHYLSNDLIETPFAYIIGTQLYTDFKLFGEKNQVSCMMEAQRAMNDFRYCTQYDKKSDKVIPFTAEQHAKLFKACWGYISNRLTHIKNNRSIKDKKPVILVTHHAPTPYSIAEEYKNDPLSAAFASDLRWFIDEHPEIRLICHGHVHSPVDYVYKNCRIVAEPFGYYWENNNEWKDEDDIKNYGLRIPIKDITSIKPWTEILGKEIEYGLVKVYEN